MPLVIISHPPRARKSTAEASCSEVKKEKRPPTTIPFQMRGTVTSRKARAPVAPTLAAASSSERCTRSSDAYAPRDRKSTRLNSSHVEISYAVFCLKKKKKNKSYYFFKKKKNNKKK